MTIYERIEKLGFKSLWVTGQHTRYKRRNVEITVQENFRDGFNIYVEVIKRGYTIELQKHVIAWKDADSTIKLISKFIKKEVGR